MKQDKTLTDEQKVYWLKRSQDKIYQSAAAGSEQLAVAQQFLEHSQQMDASILKMFAGVRDAYAVLASFLELHIKDNKPYTPKKAGMKLPSFDPGKIIHGFGNGQVEGVAPEKEQDGGK